MSKDALSFDFSNITVDTGPSINDIPLDTPLYALVDSVEFQEFNGQQKFVVHQSIFIDPQDDTQVVKFKTYIGPKQGWVLAQYLEAVGQDFRSLSGTELTASALETVLAGEPLQVRFRLNKYTDGQGVEKSSKQINSIKKFEK